ncbi:hypothetical protein [Bacillus sp. Marseille-P3800]|uniref:hypothetical protein n=1 Tax=Bacillus sp. Marseille-P3800 TaxID=2014782 RepID=UPI000C06E6CB|nr:hypothetical protein [Bacillus sp. Marseille-P3800]
MKRRVSILLIIITVLILSLFLINRLGSSAERINVEGIENFKPLKSTSEETYLLFYPSDSRNSQEVTLVKEINQEGEVIKEYLIHDEDFRRVSTHQKPNEINDVFLLYFAIEKCRKMQRKVQRFVTQNTSLYFLLDNAFVKR